MAKVITFYSYKGGTGRTMALANVAYILAQQQEELAKNGGENVKSVLAIDWDLEAPSLNRYFRNLFQNFHKHTKMQFGQAIDADSALNDHPGLINFFYDLKQRIDREDNQISEEMAYNLLNEIQFDNFVIETDIPYLHFLKAGKFDEEYIARVRYFDWQNFFNKADGLFYAWAEKLADKYSYALIDSRAGITDIGDICTMIMPEKLVAVFVPNRQSVTGLTELIERAISYRAQSEDPRPLVVFPLPSRIELGEKKLRDIWRYGGKDEAEFEEDKILGYQPKFEKLFQKVYSWKFSDSRCDLGEYFGKVQIPHIPRYAYGEDIATLLELPHSPQWSLAESYQRFTQILLKDGPWEEQRRKPPTQRREIIEIERSITKANRLTKSGDLLRALVVSLQASLNTFEGHDGLIWDVSFCPDGGKIVASASADGTIRLWDLQGDCINVLKDDKDSNPFRSISFSHDGSKLASASGRSVKLWKLDSVQLLGNFKKHRDVVSSVCFTSDDQNILSASNDNTLKLWTTSGAELQTFDEHTEAVKAVTISPDGEQFLSASSDGTIRLWQLFGSTQAIATMPQPEKEPDLVNLQIRACEWLKDFLLTNPYVIIRDRYICSAILI